MEILPSIFSLGIAAATAAFTTARILLWAVGVIAAWYEIIENAEEKEQEAKLKRETCSSPGPSQPKRVDLTATTLAQHDHQEPPARRWPTHIPPMAGVSEMGEDESVDQWSIWQDQQQHATAAAPQQPAAIINTHLPGHTVQVRQIPIQNHSELPPNHLSSSVRPADKEDAQVLASSALGGNADYIKEPPKEVIRHGPGGEKHKVKKPFFARKVEKWFVAPYAQKYERVGYMFYKGAIRVERGIGKLASDLDCSIKLAGVSAVDRVEIIMRRYIKFFGTVVLLTVVLLPLPSLHVTLGVA